MSDRITRKKIMLELPCPISDHELLNIARDKARHELELDEIAADFADVKRDWNGRVEAKEKHIAQLGAVIRTGEQKRPIACFERYVDDGEHKGKVETVRSDTQEVVERRVADLLEARNATPDAEPPGDEDVLAQAARMQRAAGVEENEDGDVVVPEERAPKKKRGKKS